MILTTDLEDLEIRDEIVTNLGSEMRYYRVMEKPRLSSKGVYWNGRKRYIAVKCQVCIEEVTTSGIYHWNNKPWIRTSKVYKFQIPEEDSPIIKVGLNFRNIVIINR